MPARRRSRERALQILYQWDMRKEPVEDAIAAFYNSLYSEQNQVRPKPDGFMEQLVKGAAQNISDIDRRISQHAAHWRLERMPTVDRNIIRLALYEMMDTDTPAPVAIDEALELARRFSNEQSVQFVNGVLDAVHRELARESGAPA